MTTSCPRDERSPARPSCSRQDRSGVAGYWPRTAIGALKHRFQERTTQNLAKDHYLGVEALILGKESELSMGLVDPRVGLGWCWISDYIVQHRQCS